MYRRTLASLAIVGMVLATGCAEEQPMIDRTEANALPKSLFTGEWFYNQTVIDAPNIALPSFIPVGSVNYSGAKRVRWDIQEGFLYARKSYELIKGATRETVGGGIAGETGNDKLDEQTGEFKGSIVGAWAIKGHFDIRRQYNPTTGQEINVLAEIASDCKWYDCRYMRVDWSRNYAIDYLFLDHDEDIKKEPLPFYFENEDDPRYKPLFDEKNGYIDVVTAMTVNPGQISFNWRGRTYTYPLCWWQENSECNTIALKLRHSFWKRDPNRDYQPRQHIGAVTEWFGFFTADRLTWDNRVGMLETRRVRLINRHNIWERWHLDKACTTNDDCKDPGSECDTLLSFFKVDTETDSDFDGLPDVFEQLAGLNPKAADSNGNKKVDRQDDKVGLKYTYAADGKTIAKVEIDPNPDGMADIQNYWKWADLQKEYRCTMPIKDRAPRPVAYFNTGYFPRDMMCDSDDATTKGHCSPWKWSADVDTRFSHDSKWSVTHQISANYDDAFWRIFLRGGYGWSQAKLDAWTSTHDPKNAAFTEDDRKVLARFGDINDPQGKNGLYAFTICANNPPQDGDPWPCRFNKMSWAEAQAAMAAGKDTIANRPLVRRGDLRFSQINYVSGYNQGLLGLGPSHTDPVTGENFAGVANVYQLNDVAANNTREMVGLLNGNITPTDYIDGVDMTNWIKSLNLTLTARGANGAGRSFTHAQLKSAYAATVQPWMKRIVKRGNPADLMKAQQKMPNRQVRAMMLSQLNASGLFDPAKATAPGLDLIKGTSIEKRLVDNEVLMGSGYAANASGLVAPELTDDVLNKASLARGGWIKAIDAREEWKRQMSSRHNMFFMDMADDAMIGLATRLKDKSQEEVFKTARRIIMRAVLTHEMGHTFGLHHNWAGSEDVVNFFPDYWRLRTNDYKETKPCTGPWTRSWDQNSFGDPAPQAAPTAGDGKLCPFFIKPMNDYQKGLSADAASQKLRSMHEYSYSSIMDYAGRYTIDGGGLGRYDVAAMMYGHADAVEVYDKSPINDATTIGAGGVPFENWFQEWFENDGNPTIFYSRPKSFHYTNWWSYMAQTGDAKNLYDEKNRMVVNYQDVKSVRDATGRDYGLFYRDGNALHPRVPYLFCTYTRGDISEGCNTRDYGADTYEKMKQHIDSWDSYYPLRSFTRYTYGISPDSYIGRNYRRMYYKLKDFNNAYALYQGLFRQWFKEEDTKAFFTDAVDGWAPYTIALNDAFNMAMRTLAMPDIKAFSEDTTPDGQAIYNEATFGSAFTPELTNGRYFTTSYRTGDFENVCGLQWWECLHHIGFYTDKIMALLSLSDARTYFVGQDTAEDVREYRISFFDNYSEQMIDFFGSVLGNEYDTHAPWYDKSLASQPSVMRNGHEWRYGVAWREYADKTQDVPKPAGGRAIEPATRFTLKMYIMVIGMLNLENNFDKSFTQRSLMWKKGTNTGWDITPTDVVAGTIEFVDPFSGYTYTGADYKDKRGIAQRMIAYANRLKARTKYCNSTDTTAPDYCQTLNTMAEGTLWDYTQLMEVMTDLTQRYSGWGNWNWNPFDP